MPLKINTIHFFIRTRVIILLFDESSEILVCCILPTAAVRALSSAAIIATMEGDDLDKMNNYKDIKTVIVVIMGSHQVLCPICVASSKHLGACCHHPK
jgi:uncharacterized membrane protein (DUF4010 family)